MKRILALACALTVTVALAVSSGGCARIAAAPSPRIIGNWFDDRTGSQYRFVSDSIVVLPQRTAGGGNALTYSLVDDRLDISEGAEHRVSMVVGLTTDRLVLSDPITGERQVLLRRVDRTAFTKQLAASAVKAASSIASITALADIVWVAARPEGHSADWTSWSPSTLDAYAAAWDWSKVEQAKGTRVMTFGGGPAMGFSFELRRAIPTPEDLAAARENRPSSVAATSVEPTAGSDCVDVGYAASRVAYPAGTLVYLPGGLVYSLGGGYAIPVGLNLATRSFVPLTHE